MRWAAMLSRRNWRRRILFLTSDESSFTTGIALPVDGGRTFH